MTAQTSLVSLSRRLLAHYIDFFILLIPIVTAIYFIAINTSNLNQLILNSLQMIAFVLLPLILFNSFYSIILLHYFGATIGQMLAGFSILDQNGEKLSMQRLFFRQTVGKAASASLFGLGYYSIIKNPQKQAWHDEIVGSYPVSKKNTWPLALISLIFIISILGYFSYLSIITFAKNNDLKNDFQNYSSAFTKSDKNLKNTLAPPEKID